MKVYLVPSITCQLCGYFFEAVADKKSNTVTLEHKPYAMNDGKLCEQTGQVAEMHLGQFEREI